MHLFVKFAEATAVLLGIVVAAYFWVLPDLIQWDWERQRRRQIETSKGQGG